MSRPPLRRLLRPAPVDGSVGPYPVTDLFSCPPSGRGRVFTIGRSGCSRCSDFGVHDGPICAFTIDRNTHPRAQTEPPFSALPAAPSPVPSSPPVQVTAGCADEPVQAVNRTCLLIGRVQVVDAMFSAAPIGGTGSSGGPMVSEQAAASTADSARARCVTISLRRGDVTPRAGSAGCRAARLPARTAAMRAGRYAARRGPPPRRRASARAEW